MTSVRTVISKKEVKPNMNDSPESYDYTFMLKTEYFIKPYGAVENIYYFTFSDAIQVKLFR